MEIRLKDVRESRNVTQEAVAQHIGVSQQYISRVERGTKQITLDLATDVADYLNVSLDEIAGRTYKAETNQKLENLIKGE